MAAPALTTVHTKIGMRFGGAGSEGAGVASQAASRASGFVTTKWRAAR
jgi:hypothetical protein